MSNDTDFDLTFICPSREMLEHAITYLERKEERWNAWRQRGKGSAELMERTGASNAAAVVSWGFRFGDIEVDDDGEAAVNAKAWANENATNIWISGEEGELADLLRQFPFLEISGRYSGEYNSGDIDGCECC